jgi:hypothetical protein
MVGRKGFASCIRQVRQERGDVVGQFRRRTGCDRQSAASIPS